MLDTDDINRILVEIVTGQPPTLTTPEAIVMRAKLQKECDAIVAKGGVVDIPPEIPDIS
jgi:hypothetical protein